MRRSLPTVVIWPLLAVVALAGCGGDDESDGSQDGPVASATDDDGSVRLTATDPATSGDVLPGAAFTFGDFSVAQGWRVRPVERSVGIGETTTSPEISGEVTNEGDEAAFALFEMVFADGSEPVSTVKCSSGEIPPGETVELLCPGLGQPVPEGYDQIVVQEITR